MSYLPNVTTRLAGDTFRNPDKDTSIGLGRMLNASRKLYSRTTGYTMQRYNSSSVVTPQTFALGRIGGGKVNVLTTPNESLSNNNVKGLLSSKVK